MDQRSRRQDFGDWSDGFGDFTVYDSVEAMDGVGGVFDQTSGAIGFDQRVGPLHNIAMTSFLLALNVTS